MNVNDIVEYKDCLLKTCIGRITNVYPNEYVRIIPFKDIGPIYKYKKEVKLFDKTKDSKIPPYCNNCVIEDKTNCEHNEYCKDIAKTQLNYLCEGCKGPTEVIKKEVLENFLKICGKKALPDKYSDCPNEQFCVLLNEYEKGLK